MRAGFLVVLIACTRPPAPGGAIMEPPAVDARERHFTIWLGGARVGTAHETETASVDGVVLRRTETLRFLRDTTLVTLVTELEIVASAALEPRRVRWREHGPTRREAEAIRESTGWVVDNVVVAPPEAIPAELVPLRVRRDAAFAGTVFLPSRGWLVGSGRIDSVGEARLVARLVLEGGARAEATIDLAADRTYARVVDGDGVIAIRASAVAANAPFAPVDLIAATAIPLHGAPGSRLVLDGPAMLPPVPGQLARTVDDGLEVALSSALPGGLPALAPSRDRAAQISRLVREVQARIAPDLGAGLAAPATADAANRGDCTTYALAYAAHAARHAIPTQLVTGLRVDGTRLVRHRWAVSWTGRAWIAIDAAFGAAPAGGNLVGLALHAADDAGLVAGEAALAQVRAARWR